MVGYPIPFWLLSVFCHSLIYSRNHIGGIVVSVLTSIVVGRGFQPWSGQT
jgi:hypothetical protein